MLNVHYGQRFLLDMSFSTVDYHNSAGVRQNWAISNCFTNHTLQFKLKLSLGERGRYQISKNRSI